MGPGKNMNVVLFGGSNTEARDYAQAERLGRLLGEAGHTVLTGGYIGSMEAVSKGAALAGAHVIGVTCDQIENWRPVRPNQWVKEERRYKTMMERLYALIDGCDAAIALPGGPGTLTEVALTWNLLLTDSIAPRPLILLGSGWKTVIEAFLQTFPNYVPANQRTWLTFAERPEDALEILSAGR